MPTSEVITEIPVFDIDTHYTEPADLWTSRAPAKYKDSMNAEWFIQNNHDSWNAAPSDEERHRLLNVLAICMNWHARTGIGDLPSWGMPQLRNVEMVSKLVEVAETIGRDIATPNEAREMLGLN